MVDAFQGVEAQTVANAYAAMEHDLTIIPVINKIDLAYARPDEVLKRCIRRWDRSRRLRASECEDRHWYRRPRQSDHR